MRPSSDRLSRPAICPVLIVVTCCVVGLVMGPVAGIAPASAEVAVGATVGTLGVGAELVIGTPRLQGRFGFSTFEIDADFETDTVDYDGELELQNLVAVLDWYPTGGSFRLSGGVVLNDNAVIGTAPIEQLVDIPPGLPPVVLEGLGFLRGEATIDEVVPYVGLGFGNPFAGDGRWRFRFDLGVLITGEPDVSLDAVINVPIPIPPEIQALIDAFLLSEQADLEDEIGDFDLYPVLAFGVAYRF